MRYSQMPARLTAPQCDQLPVSRISPRPSLQRGQNEGSLEALAESIRRYGLLHPVIVRRSAPGRYVILSGNRRLMACRMLGMLCISVQILRDDARWQSADCLMDALMRNRLHYLEEADALDVLHNVHGMSWTELAAALGRRSAALQAQSELQALPDEMKALLLEEQVPLGIALTLMRLHDDGERIALAERIARERLCIRDSALLVTTVLNRKRRSTKKQPKERCENEVIKWEGNADEHTRVSNWEEVRRHTSVSQMISVVRDARLYLNSIRQLTAQMQEAGYPATVSERHTGRETELLIRVPIRRRRADRYQSM